MTLVRLAISADAEQLFTLARDFATSFTPEPSSFGASLAHLISQEDALLLVAEESGRLFGYVLGFDHYAFFANGKVSWVEEIMVREDHRREGIGEELMAEFERWASSRRSKLVALATRQAAEFYLALGYEESASYFRKLL